MPVIPINDDFSNIAEFINSLFSPGVRSSETLQKAISAEQLYVSFAKTEEEKILDCWQAAWMPTLDNASTILRCPTADQRLMQFLSNHIGSNGLSMFVPRIKLAKLLDGGQPVYELGGYDRRDFKSGDKWNPEVVRQFLELFLYGAHFIAIHFPQDLPKGNAPVLNLYQQFKGGPLKDFVQSDPGESHYTKLTSLKGYYFPKITSEQATNPASFTCACLVGPTMQGASAMDQGNSFMQLEGWPETRILGTVPNPGGRHITDYKTYLGSFWNISTYGACAYSERRGTAIFLAPPNWPAQVTPSTIMPPFAGAYTAQAWLDKSLVQLA